MRGRTPGDGSPEPTWESFLLCHWEKLLLEKKKRGGVMYSSDTPFQEDVMQVNVQGKNDCI